ncbi:MAG TPA: alpha/beta hydrolase [Candidatus Caccomorpha excrementavium]|nr:alpha/beta hydrolase [Candidatus Caccomorpha excrementavium]
MEQAIRKAVRRTAAAVLAAGAGVTAVSWRLANVVLKPKMPDNEGLYDREVKRGRLNEQFYRSLRIERFILMSRYGYGIACEYLRLPEDKEKELGAEKTVNGRRKVAVLSHGFTSTKYASAMYAEIFLNRGFEVVIYDQRNHGQSGKAYTTMGYYEKFDLQTVLDWCENRFGGDSVIVTHGESMGAATVLNHLVIDKRPAAVIADCGYTDLGELLKYQLTRRMHLPVWPFFPVADILLRLRAGFRVREVRPADGVKYSRVPILFIHGAEDHFVPTRMSVQMHEMRRESTELLIVPGAAHAVSFNTDRALYESAVDAFLNRYVYGREEEKHE